MVTLMDPNDPQEERVFLALRRLQLPHLRDTLPDLLRHRYSDEIASLSLSSRFVDLEGVRERPGG